MTDTQRASSPSPRRSREREQFLADVITGAVEGGTGYWAQVSGYHWSDDEPATTRVTLHDMDDGKVYPVTIDTVEQGIERIKDPAFEIGSLRGVILAADVTLDAGEIDADAADAIVQAGVLGEIVYG